MEAGSPGLALPSPFRSDPRPKVAPFWSECAERREGWAERVHPKAVVPWNPCGLAGVISPALVLDERPSSCRVRGRGPRAWRGGFGFPLPITLRSGHRLQDGPRAVHSGRRFRDTREGKRRACNRDAAARGWKQGAGGRARRGRLGVPGSREDAQACSTLPARGGSSVPPLRPLGHAHRAANPRPSGSESPPPGC